MRIALLQPTYWPEVRRGSERLVHDLGSALSDRGHDVTLITSHRDRSATAIEDGMTVSRAWRPGKLAPLRWYEDHVANVPSVAARLMRGRFDVAHAFFTVDGWTAAQARRAGGPPFVFSFHGIPIRKYLVERRYRLEMLERAVANASAVTVLSEAAAETFKRYLPSDPMVLPGGVSDEMLARPLAAPSETPTIFCAASLGDPRKGADVLFAAFSRLLDACPQAQLRIARVKDPVMSWWKPELPANAKWVDVDEPEAIAQEFGSAWVSVLPSIDEAFGLVILESFACGTPVIAARSGGCPELVDDEVGALFDPGNVASLAGALAQRLEAPADESVRRSCRARAAPYAWSELVERYERLYLAAI